MLTTTPLLKTSFLRDAITNAYRMDETECLNLLIPQASFSENTLYNIAEIAKQLVVGCRIYKKKQGKVDTLLQQYDLSTDEGIALMCLAEALLRIPDKFTMDKLISDKISTVEWKTHLNKENPFFVNAATWSLLLSGKIYSPTLTHQKNLLNSLNRAISRLGVAVIRPVILQMMKAIGKQFVMGEDIHSALKDAVAIEKCGYLFSYDMLGEAAHTAQDASHYYDAYLQAINAIGAVSTTDNPRKNPGISVKLSALHPRYEYTQRERLLKELPPLVLALAEQAKKYHIGFVIDAEEADRLDVSLDIFEKVYSHPSLADWEGFGLALQAYQKRSSFVLDWLIDLAKLHNKRIFVRLVKGAYWDTEIKISQVQGLNGYPVFTRKSATDVSYIACANKLLAHNAYFYPQFGTHNAYSVATILQIAKPENEFEFQCLHGMGRPLYDQIIGSNKFNQPVRIYAPVGTHRDLLGYLVRRLLENGANSSFLNKLADETIPIEKLIADPVANIVSHSCKPHPRILLPKDIYGEWQNSQGIDLSNQHEFLKLKKQMEKAEKLEWVSGPIVNGKVFINSKAQALISPSNIDCVVGHVNDANETHVEQTLQAATMAAKTWGQTSVLERSALLERAADLLQKEMPNLIYLVSREGGRCVLDCISEVREAIDYCHYYAYRARHDFKQMDLPSPTGEANQLFLHPRGVFTCISPWNFPVAIFTGQIVAALATGNTVIAKPAEQTPLVAFKVVQILHQAGIPKNVLQLLTGPGHIIGAKLVSDNRVDGVVFTGSTETAKLIGKSLADRSGPIATFIAETGGLNAMIVDSSALPEQTVIDIAQSAFNSAGQRCSALRILFLQEDIAPKFLDMLKGYMAELTIGNPCLLSTDIGPVIDRDAQTMLKNHFAKMHREAKLIAQVPQRELPNGYYFAPCVFELDNLSHLEGEIFGPILHVIRYPARDLNKVMDAIANTGFGLTLGIHSRIDATIHSIAKQMPVGNIYVNRNMIGAVVGVQPFGGEHLSGTGPKAGGPHYLPRFCVERTVSTNTAAIGGNASLVSILEDD